MPNDPSAILAKMTIDAIAEPDDLPDFAVQPGVVDSDGFENAADSANIPDDDGVLYVGGQGRHRGRFDTHFRLVVLGALRPPPLRSPVTRTLL